MVSYILTSEEYIPKSLFSTSSWTINSFSYRRSFNRHKNFWTGSIFWGSQYSWLTGLNEYIYLYFMTIWKKYYLIINISSFCVKFPAFKTTGFVTGWRKLKHIDLCKPWHSWGRAHEFLVSHTSQLSVLCRTLCELHLNKLSQNVITVSNSSAECI